jgi:hypothetical protein
MLGLTFAPARLHEELIFLAAALCGTAAYVLVVTAFRKRLPFTA